MEKFMIAAFRSRMHVMAFERTLKTAGLRASVVSTPRAVALGCGLSVRFEAADLMRVRQLLPGAAMSNLIGLYSVEYDTSGRSIVRAVHSQPGHDARV